MQSNVSTSIKASWAGYLWRGLGVVVAIEVGLVLVTLPWTRLWAHSIWVADLHSAHPLLWAVLQSPGLRGAISGLGLLNLWIAASEIIPSRF